MFERTISVILLSKLASHGRLHLTYTYDLETYPNTGFPRISASAIIEDKTNIPRVAFPVHCFQVVIWSSIERLCPFPNFLWHARKAAQRAECGISNEDAQSGWIMLFRERSWSIGSARTLLLVNKITTEKAQLIYRCGIRTLSYSTYNWYNQWFRSIFIWFCSLYGDEQKLSDLPNLGTTS